MGRRPIATLLFLAVTTGMAACGDDGGMPAPAPTAGQAAGAGSNSSGEPRGDPAAGVLSGTLPLLNGEPQDLAEYKGEVVLVVNTATECGFTPQFDGLERLYEAHRGDGFVILGFPADDVAHQEPRSDDQIAEFCEENFGVSFPMFAKSNVVSEPLNPVFERLNAAAGPPSWNFNKYLLDREGKVVDHYEVATEPDDPALNEQIELLLRS
jgi:glutathione peroxidase